ncbi:CD320 antigen isoform X2 [Excalfactoria chinensis]|uniref:CD320 antigen isoform X2 n=1 Tax=Excalfactoria chinensis TaxID=46218 RepID=UPI003B3BD661
MARLLAVLVLLRAARPLPGNESGNESGNGAGNGSLSRCPPGHFGCSEPLAPHECYPRDWLCDGHPDCEDGRDERGCGTSAIPAVPTSGGTEAPAVLAPGRALQSRNHGRMWMLIIAGIFCCEVVRWD